MPHRFTRAAVPEQPRPLWRWGELRRRHYAERRRFVPACGRLPGAAPFIQRKTGRNTIPTMLADRADVSQKSRPKAALFTPDDDGSDGRQCWLRLLTIGQEAKAGKAEQQHCPSCGFGDGVNAFERERHIEGRSRISAYDVGANAQPIGIQVFISRPAGGLENERRCC